MVIDKAHIVERFNTTLKENVCRRLHAMGLDINRWTSQSKAVVNTYNNTGHRTIKMPPADARKESNAQYYYILYGLSLKRIGPTPN